MAAAGDERGAADRTPARLIPAPRILVTLTAATFVLAQQSLPLRLIAYPIEPGRTALAYHREILGSHLGCVRVLVAGRTNNDAVVDEVEVEPVR